MVICIMTLSWWSLLLSAALTGQTSWSFQLGELVMVSGDRCYYDQDNPKGSCFVFPYDTARWSEAELDCEEGRGGTYAAFSDGETLRIISEGMREEGWASAWIGIRRHTADDWRWIGDQQFVNFSAWKGGQAPGERVISAKDCALVVPYEDFEWSEKQCGFAAGYICETVTNTTLCENAKYEYDEVFVTGDRCFFVKDNIELSWFLSRMECEQVGAVLAQIDESSIQDRLVQASPGTDTQSEGYWIGLARVEWVSATGEEIKHYFWESGQPSRTNSDCVRMEIYGRGYLWANWNCEDDLNYICEIPISVETSSEPTLERAPYPTTSRATELPTTGELSIDPSAIGETGSVTPIVSTRKTSDAMDATSVLTEDMTQWTRVQTAGKRTTSEAATSTDYKATSTDESTSELNLRSTSETVAESRADATTTDGITTYTNAATTVGVTSHTSASSTANEVPRQPSSRETTTKADTKATTVAFTARKATTQESNRNETTRIAVPSTVANTNIVAESTLRVTHSPQAESTAELHTAETPHVGQTQGRTEPTVPLCIKVDTLFILDTSMEKSNWTETLLFTSGIIKYHIVSEECLQVSVLTYSNDTTVLLYLNSYRDTASAVYAVESLTNEPVAGSSVLGLLASLQEAHRLEPETGDRLDVPNVVILITDGETLSDNDLVQAINAQAAAMHKDGMYGIVVNLGSIQYGAVVKSISSPPTDSFYMHVDHFDQLLGVTQDVADLLRETFDVVSIGSSMATEVLHHGVQTSVADGTASTESQTTVSGDEQWETTPQSHSITNYGTEVALNSTVVDMALSDGADGDVNWFVIVLAVGLPVIAIAIALLAGSGLFCWRRRRQRRKLNDERIYLSACNGQEQLSQASATSLKTRTSGDRITTPWGSMSRPSRKSLKNILKKPPFGLAKADDLPNTMFYNSWRIPAK